MGRNFAVVYPFVQVILNDGQSLQDWIDGEIEESQERCDELRSEIQQLQQGLLALDGGARADRESRIRFQQSRLDVEQSELARSRKFKPYLEYTPDSPFQAMVLIVLCLSLGTVLKDVFLVLNMILVERVVQLAVFDLRKQFFDKPCGSTCVPSPTTTRMIC